MGSTRLRPPVTFPCREMAEGHLWGVSIEKEERRGLSQISFQDLLLSRRFFSLLWRENSCWTSIFYMFWRIKKEGRFIECRAKTYFFFSVPKSAVVLQSSWRYFSSEKGRGDKSAAGRRAASADPPFYNNEVKNKKPMTRRGPSKTGLIFSCQICQGCH